MRFASRVRGMPDATTGRERPASRRGSGCRRRRGGMSQTSYAAQAVSDRGHRSPAWQARGPSRMGHPGRISSADVLASNLEPPWNAATNLPALGCLPAERPGKRCRLDHAARPITDPLRRKTTVPAGYARDPDRGSRPPRAPRPPARWPDLCRERRGSSPCRPWSTAWMSDRAHRREIVGVAAVDGLDSHVPADGQRGDRRALAVPSGPSATVADERVAAGEGDGPGCDRHPVGGHRRREGHRLAGPAGVERAGHGRRRSCTGRRPASAAELVEPRMLATPAVHRGDRRPPRGSDVVVKPAVPAAVTGSVASTVPPC